MDAYRQRKLFLFAMVHAVVGYLGARKGYMTTHQALMDAQIQAAACRSLHPVVESLSDQGKWEREELKCYARQVIRRIKALQGDPVERVCRNPRRKLARDDRLVGPALLVLGCGRVVPCGLIAGVAAALDFCLRQAAGNSFVARDEEAVRVGAALQSSSADLEPVIAAVCGLSHTDPLENWLVQVIREAFIRFRARPRSLR
jgi:mannitol-1-phosphate 5-dehydrogenase